MMRKLLISKKKGILLIVLVGLLVGAGNMSFGQAVGDYGTRYTSGTPYNWNTATNWVVCVTAGTWIGATTAAAVPNNTKNVRIRAGANYTVNATASCSSLTFEAVSANSLLSISGTNTLTVGGLITMPRPSNGFTCTIAVGDGSLTAGSLTMVASTTPRNDIISINAGTVTINGTVTTGTTGCQFNFTGDGTLDFNGSFASSPTITTATGSTVKYSFAGAQTVRAAIYSNLTISGSGTKTLGAATTVSNNLSVLSGTLADGGFQITGNAIGNLSVANGATLQIGAGGATTEKFPTLYTTAKISLGSTSTVIYNSTSAMTVGGSVTSEGPSTYGHLTLSGASIKTAASAITVAGNLTVNAGTLADGGFQITGNATGTLNVANGATLQIGKATATTETFPTLYTTAKISLGSTSTVIYNSTSAMTVGGSVTSEGPSTYGHLTLSGASIKTAASAITIAGNLTINAGTFADGGNTIIVNGNVTNNATHSGAGTILLSGGSVPHAISGGTSAFGSLNLDDAQGATFTGTGTTTVNGNLNVASGTLTINGLTTALIVVGTTNISGILLHNSTAGTRTFTGLVTVNLNGEWRNTANESITFRGGITNSGTFTAGTGVHTFDTNAQELTGTLVIPNVTVTTVNLTNNNSLDVSNALGGTGTLIQANNANLLLGGTSAITGVVANASGNTINYDGAAQTVKAVTYNNLTLSGSLAKTLTGVNTINGNFVMSGSATATPITTLNVSGSTTLSGTSILTLGAANILPVIPVILDGGTFRTGSGAGFNETVGTLDLSSNSIIALGTGNHSLTFSDSHSLSWAGSTLTITGWAGTAGVSGTAGKIYVGVGGLDDTQLAKISFNTFPGTPIILGTGELVPPRGSPVLAITGTPVNHGSSCIDVAKTSIAYTITNTGGAASGVTVTSNDPQFVVSNLSSTTIANGGSATYDVTFTPSASGSQSATITVASTTSGSNSPTSSLTGTGNPLPSAAITPNPIDAALGICYSGTGAVASVSWAAVSGATSYDVYFGTGSLPGSVTSNVPTNSYTTGALSASTTYYWKVVPKNACGDATGSSTWTFTTTSSTCLGYCAISAINSRPITRVIFNGFNNTSSNANTTTPSFEDFTSTSANVQVGQTYSITVEGNTWGISSNANTFYYSVYIDWNQNGNFSEVGESFQVGTLNSSTGIDGQQISTNIVIPISASLGSTRMRVIGQFGGYNANSCEILNGPNSYGQAEDYTLNIVPACSTAPIAICKDVTVDLDATGNVSITGNQVDNGSTSTCGNALSYAVSPSSFTCANLGSNTVTLTVTDDGNSTTATCTATVTVRDVTLPTIANCPANINIEVPFGNSGKNVIWAAPSAADNCGVTTFTSNHNSGDFFYLGSTTVTYTAKDNSLNTATCSFTVKVTMADCNPMGINASGQVDWISKIDFGSFAKTSGPSNYSDYTSDVINLARNTSQNITLTPGFSASSYDEYWRVWIDLNKDGDYLDSGELLYSGNSTSPITSSIAIPDVTVNTTMRVAMKGAHTDDLTVPGGTATSQYNDWPVGEDIAKLVDNTTATKYLTFNSSGWVHYRFPSGEKYVVTKYSMASANDAEERDPKGWTLQGSNDGSNWTTIDTRVNEDFPTRFLTREFICANTVAYEYYRLNMTNNSGTILQIAEWELFEIDDTPYPEPCEPFAYGEVEDYKVNIAPACIDGSLSLISITGTDAQTVCINTPITAITYIVGGGATGATVAGLPSGVTSSFNGGIVTISGSPGANSTYTISTTGTPSPCNEAIVTGSISVNALPTVTWLGALTNQCISSSSYTLTGGLPSGGTYSGTGVTGTNFDATTAGVGTKTLTYTYTDANGCINTATNTITVNALPPTPTIGAVIQPTCSTSTGSFTIANYDLSYTYLASPSTGVSVFGNTVTASAGAYTLTATLGTCTSVASASVIIDAQPVTPVAPTLGIASPVNGSVICAGFNTGVVTGIEGSGGTLGAANEYQVSINGGSTYNVYTNGAAITTTGATGSVIVQARRTGGDYGCNTTTWNTIATWPISSVTMNPALNVATPADGTSICAGYSLKATIITGSGGSSGAADLYEYSINNGGSWSAYTSENIINTSGATGNILIRVGRSGGNYGCSATGPITVVTWPVTPNVDTPVFELGSTSTRCQEAGSVTYTATATNSTGLTYTLDSASSSAGNSIDANSGIVTYVEDWSGTTIITANAAGCNGPKTATHTVTVNPLPDPGKFE